jgi:hypothetical protein
MSVQTLFQLNTLFQSLTASITGIPGTQIRPAYQQGGQPFQDISADIIYFWINYIDNPYNRQRNTSYSYPNSTVEYTRVINVDWFLYGPDSFDYADTLRNGLEDDTSFASLSAFGVYGLIGFDAPVRAPFLLNGQWWDRTDFSAKFNVDTTRVYTMPDIQVVDILVYDEAGLVATVNGQFYELDFSAPLDSQYLGI